MHVTLDYLVAGLVIIIILAFSANSIFSLTSVNLKHVEEEQLNPLTERLLDKILLTPGEPTYWGNIYDYEDEADITGFGLAYIKNNVINSYVIDPDKMSRMIHPVFQISPERITNLLGLTWDGGHPKYGFRLRIVPALNITIIPDESSYVKIGNDKLYTNFTITVRSYDGYPAANSKIKAMYLAAKYKEGGGGQEDCVDYSLIRSSTTADWKGEGNIKFSISSAGFQGYNKASFILIVYASYSGIKSFNTYNLRSQDILNASIIGNYLIVEFPQNEDPQGARFLRGLVQISEYAIAEAKIKNVSRGESGWVINKGGKSYRVYEISGMDPSLNTDVLFIKWIGRFWISVMRYPPLVDYAAPSMAQALKIVTLHRYCRIGELTYVAELSVWRMAE
ncbi:MAG: hypothetical protein QXK51_11420 [Candidatus Methanomethylicia archaeon]